ncbi:MAG: NEW3 domain-containing protein [Caldilineaceae bacterium]
MRKSRFVLLVIVSLAILTTPLTVYAQATTPAANPATAATPSATPAPLAIFTNYPSQVVGLGETATLPLKVRSGTPGTVDLSVQNAPEGWAVSFRGGNRIVSSTYADGVNDATVDLRVETPADAKAGEVKFNVVAKSGDQTSTLPLALTVQEKLPPKLSLTTELPTLRNKPGSSFRYDTSLKNEGDEDLTVDLSADATPGFNISFSLNGQDVTSVPLAAGETKHISVQAASLDNVASGAYPLKVRAQGGEAIAELPLSAEVVGTAEIMVTTPDGRLSGEAVAGKTTPFKIIVANPGSAPATNISVSATAPNGWTATVDPKEIAQVAPGEQVEVTANIAPSEKAVAGDYVVSVSARPADGSAKNVDLRVTVTTSTMWGIVGVGLIALAVAAVGIVVSRFGRR